MRDGPHGKEFAMDFLSQQGVMHRSHGRLTAMLDELRAGYPASKDHFERVVGDLATGLEELLVAEEELRAQAEELAASRDAIDAERERYGELFDFAPDGYFVTDGYGKILEANSAASGLMNVPARFLTGKLMTSFVVESQRREFRRLLQELAAQPQQVDERYFGMVPRDGAPVTVALRATTRAIGGEPSPVVRWSVRDVSQRIEMEEELRFLNSEVELLAALGQVARLTSEPQSVDDLLKRVVDLAATGLPQAEVSLAFLGPDGVPRIAHTSDDRAREMGAAELAGGDGPCVAAMRLGESVTVTVDGAIERWPAFGQAARKLGVSSATGAFLATPSGRRGALNVYGFAPLGEREHRLVRLLADQVVLALANAELYVNAQGLATHLQRALETRGVIERAKGVLMARQHCTDDEAFDILRRASQRLNRKLHDVAADLLEQSQQDAGPRPSTSPPPLPADPAASIRRAEQLEATARARAATERARAAEARVPSQASMHDEASRLHEVAADLQRQHQQEVAAAEVLDKTRDQG